MSTKKTKKTDKPVVKKTDTITKEEKAKLDSVAAKVAKDHEGQPKPQLLKKVEKPKKFVVGKIKATKFDFEDAATRVVDTLVVESDEDLSNKPEEVEKIMANARRDIIKDGWHLNDYAAMDAAYKQVEGFVGHLAMEIEYGDFDCKRCIAGVLRKINDSMRNIREFNDARLNVAEEVDPEKCQLPDVMPDKSEWSHYKVIDGVYTYVGPKVSGRRIQLNKDQMKDLSKILSEITGDDITGKGELVAVKERK